MPLEPGVRLGPFEILASLGAGGMGEVWRARHTKLGREVAIKTLPAAFAADPDRLARFEREAHTASNLNHPNILTIYDVGEADGRPYLATELVPGETLRVRLDRAGPSGVPITEVVDVARQMASGLAAAHEAGIVHRDLKPENVMIRPDGLVKLLDFGLAKVIAPGRPGARAVDTMAATGAHTAAGTVTGTAAYMSPEQARGTAVDARSDVFSLGVVLYELIAGRPPFRGETTTHVMVAILDQTPPSLGNRRADLPRDLVRLVDRCLEKDPGRRYESGREVLEALDRVAAALSAEAVASARAKPAEEAPSVAVLPFANMSADPENEYFCDGIAEEITAALSKVERLKVAGRTSAFSFKGKTGDLREIGKALNVGTVLEGSVRRAGQRLRITAQLVKVADGYHLWSERYDRQMEDIFDIQDEIALAVTEALKVALLGKEKAAVLKRSTENPEAYQLCLKARHAWTRWTDEGFRTALSLFEQALAKDPDYALAHYGLGDCRVAWAVLGREPVDLPRMRTHIETALRLDPDLPEARAVLGGIVEGLFGWNWVHAESECRKALELDPRSAHVHEVYSNILCCLGRGEESVEQERRALELDPLNAFYNACLIESLQVARDWEAALRQLRVTLDLAPDYWLAYVWGSPAWLVTGHPDEAIAGFERAVATSREVPVTVGLLGHALAVAGRRDTARQQLERLRDRAASQYVPSIAIAFVHAGLGEADEAFALMSRAYDEHDCWLTFALTWLPTLDDLRPDPRFAELRRRMGLSLA